MRKISLLLFLSFSIFSSSVHSGVPVLSPQELVQAVVNYKQMLADYEEQLAMVQQGYEQYQQMQEDYLLALKEWENLLEQCQAYKDLWGSYNWDKFLEEMSNYFLNKNAYSHKQIIDLYEDENYRNSRTLFITKNGKVYTYQDAIDLLNKLKFGNPSNALYEDLRIKENQINEGVKRQQYTIQNNELISNVVERIDNIENDFQSLGDNSQLATIQYQAKLQSESLNLQIHELEMLNELISQQNQLYDKSAINLHKAQTNTYERTLDALEKKIEVKKINSKINF